MATSLLLVHKFNNDCICSSACSLFVSTHQCLCLSLYINICTFTCPCLCIFICICVLLKYSYLCLYSIPGWLHLWLYLCTSVSVSVSTGISHVCTCECHYISTSTLRFMSKCSHLCPCLCLYSSSCSHLRVSIHQTVNLWQVSELLVCTFVRKQLYWLVTVHFVEPLKLLWSMLWFLVRVFLLSWCWKSLRLKNFLTSFLFGYTSLKKKEVFWCRASLLPSQPKLP